MYFLQSIVLKLSLSGRAWGRGCSVCYDSVFVLLSTAALQHQISAHLFSKEQVDVITEGLMKAFCYKSMDVSDRYVQCVKQLDI